MPPEVDSDIIKVSNVPAHCISLALELELHTCLTLKSYRFVQCKALAAQPPSCWEGDKSRCDSVGSGGTEDLARVPE
jgi:hypothetical protein